MQFSKMHGAGNDYVFVDGFVDPLPTDLTDLARRISQRRLGVGADGLIVIEPHDTADFRMRVFNADGSEAEMCGNGIRCAFKYVRDRGWLARDHARIRTRSGDREVRLVRRDPGVDMVRVEMGKPIPEGGRLNHPGSVSLELRLEAEGKTWDAACLSLGNPHAVVFVPAPVAHFPIDRYGPAIEHHPRFPDRINVTFVERIHEHEVHQRTWERGVGETQACGTAACAAVAAGCLTGRLTSPVTVHFPGGDVTVDWPDPASSMFLEGPAVEVFTGVWDHG